MLRKYCMQIILCLLTICCLCGCTKKEVESSKDYVYEEIIKELPQLQGEVVAFTQKDGKYYVCTMEEQENDKLKTILYQFEQDAKEVKSYLVSTDEDIDVAVYQILVANDERIYLIQDEYDRTKDISELYVVLMDGNGSALDSVNFKEFTNGSELMVMVVILMQY